MTMNKLISASIISTTRPAMMGIATLMILFCHSASWCTDMNTSVSGILKMGYIGVDIFLLMSGVGMYYSFKNNTSSNASFIKRGGGI